MLRVSLPHRVSELTEKEVLELLMMLRAGCTNSPHPGPLGGTAMN
ncbi:MAG TPA: hypothetical protein VE709_00925 [Pseudonocardiaceae bacterium]|nr:hypothetical protein [Pseudonocardiaceae bacterium]